MGNAQSTSGDFCYNPGNTFAPTTGFENPGFVAKATSKLQIPSNHRPGRRKTCLFVILIKPLRFSILRMSVSNATANIAKLLRFAIGM